MSDMMWDTRKWKQIDRRQRKFMAQLADHFERGQTQLLLVSPIEPPIGSMASLNQAAETRFNLITDSKGMVKN